MADDIDLTSSEALDEPADGPVDDVLSAQDAALLAELRSAAERHDAVPPAVLAAAKASLTWRTIDAELAALAFDSTADDSAVLVRGPGSDEQVLTFETERISVDLQVTVRGDQRRLVGQLAPAAVADIEVRTAAGVVVRVTSDELGRIPALDVPAGSLSLRLQLAGSSTAVVTDWVTV